MKTRKFNLSQALRGQAVCTANGKNKVMITAFIVGQPYPVMGKVFFNEAVIDESWTHTGKLEYGENDGWDLAMVTEYENS